MHIDKLDSFSSREKRRSGASRSNGRIDLQGAPELDLGAIPASLDHQDIDIVKTHTFTTNTQSL